MAYQNTGTIGPEDGDALISLKGSGPPPITSRSCAPSCREISRHDVLVSAGRHRLADPQFRPAGADRRAGHRQQPEGQLRLRHRTAQAHPQGPGIADPRIQQVFNYPQINVERRPDARRRSRADPARRRQQPAGHAVRQRPGEAEFLAQHRERRVLSDRRADAAIPDRHDVGSRQHAGDLGGDQRRNISAACAKSRRDRARASSRTTTCSRSSTSTPPPKAATSAPWPATSITS